MISQRKHCFLLTCPFILCQSFCSSWRILFWFSCLFHVILCSLWYILNRVRHSVFWWCCLDDGKGNQL